MAGSNQADQNDIENPYISLANSMRKGFNSLSPPSSECCIYRVPQRLQSVNEKLCTPQAVSIGPLHHGKEALNVVLEEHKQRYLQDFIGRTNVSLEDYIKKIKDHEARLRRCYGEPIKFSSDEFVTIILVDAAFVIELLLKNYFKIWDENDRIFDKPYMLQDVWTDMWLLENQLPFFILEDIFDPQKITLPANADNNGITEGLSIISLSFSFFEHLLPVDKLEDNLETFRSVAHIVDLFRKIFKLYQPLESAGGELPSSIPSLTELQHAGVKFEAQQGENIFDIRFSSTDGVLKIPRFPLGFFTEIMRNVLAFEQLHYPMSEDNYMSQYVSLMGGLVKTSGDVELLIEYGIARAERHL
ncbi:hypothetical protein Pyn_25433 [Prunus yedoensis var. nudiflora]|uniref:Uncharacterized protein n=1 Tax=Prunus yedoensis var. nudiflora TaxID=2094558 RepID=A0A314XNQ4_PRUYE|nr:hypothetical protein Pyn_25433 [Prunus yedoensis var. nudiflora]